MTNKYLEKAAELQERVDPVLRGHHDKERLIEAPLDELEEGMWEAHQYGRPYDDPDHDWRHRANIQYMIDSRIDAMRDQLNITKQLEDNYKNTGQDLLRAGNVEHDVADYHEGRSILNHIDRVKREHNGWDGLPTTAGTLGAIAGGIGGFAYGVRKNNPLIAGVAGIGGAILGGFGANKLTHSAVDDKIESRNKQIYDRHETNLQHAYEILRNKYKAPE